MTTVAVIPARYASTRFPGKPLARQTGKYLVQHVYEQVQQGGVVDLVVVATDDERIAEAVRSFGGSVCLTRDDHPTGTSRVAEAASSIGLPADALVLNVQGDEPEVEPSSLADLVKLMEGGAQVGTLAAPFPADGPRSGAGLPADPNCVKVVVGGGGRALYFSRSLVPYPRATNGAVDDPSRWLLHVGVYAYRVDTFGPLGGSCSCRWCRRRMRGLRITRTTRVVGPRCGDRGGGGVGGAVGHRYAGRLCGLRRADRSSGSEGAFLRILGRLRNTSCRTAVTLSRLPAWGRLTSPAAS
jgi:3-deoxy-manno-octulosonate cytidylyltransferase (CMP-KDO synthetase)